MGTLVTIWGKMKVSLDLQETLIPIIASLFPGTLQGHTQQDSLKHHALLGLQGLLCFLLHIGLGTAYFLGPSSSK